MSFRDVISEPLAERLLEKGFETMTPVQSATIPLLLSHKDVVVEAVTGSGKTLAFVVPMLEMMDKELPKHIVQALIISPTRELAKQTFSVVESLTDLSCCCLVGGTSIETDISLLNEQGASILIGTPGRILDILSRSILNTKDLKLLILDEADRLLDLGFELTLQKVFSMIPKQRRTGLFSATMTESLEVLTKAGLSNPMNVVVEVTGKDGVIKVPSSLDIFYVLTDMRDKLARLDQVLQLNLGKKILVYFSTCNCVDYFYKMFKNMYPILSLHGRVVQKKREQVYEKFVGSNSILFCTDVAARGLDLPDIDLVIQFDPPQDPKAFAHRCGRSGRFGRQGKAVIFLTPNEDTFIDFLHLRHIPMEEWVLDDIIWADFSKRIRSKMDQALLQVGQKAFVSWVRSYQAHQAHLIFRFKEVNLFDAMKMFCLTKVPKMPELRHKTLPEIKDQDELNSAEEQLFHQLWSENMPAYSNKPKQEKSWSATKEKVSKKKKRLLSKLKVVD